MKLIRACLLVLVVVFVGGFLAVQINESVKASKIEPLPSPAEGILKGDHELRKMAERTELNSRVSASFFLFVGDFAATTKTNVSVKFAWKMNFSDTYAISSLPLEKIRVKFDEKAKIPTIKFRWRQYAWPNRIPQVQELMNDYVLYAIVAVRESDWPIQVNLPLNNP